MTLTSREKKHFRQIAHHLEPVVTIADRGLVEAVLEETTRALADHELIKVRLANGDRAERTRVSQELAEAVNAEVVQTIGKILVLFKPNRKPNPKLSNIIRYS
jgi:RNA-binding protein